MNKTIIFDFDGTLANTLDAVVKIVNQHAEEFGYRKVTKKDISYLQGKNQRKFYHIWEFQLSNSLFGSKKFIQK